jgi:hypothetical protein
MDCPSCAGQRAAPAPHRCTRDTPQSVGAEEPIEDFRYRRRAPHAAFAGRAAPLAFVFELATAGWVRRREGGRRCGCGRRWDGCTRPLASTGDEHRDAAVVTRLQLDFGRFCGRSRGGIHRLSVGQPPVAALFRTAHPRLRCRGRQLAHEIRDILRTAMFASSAAAWRGRDQRQHRSGPRPTPHGAAGFDRQPPVRWSVVNTVQPSSQPSSTVGALCSAGIATGRQASESPPCRNACVTRTLSSSGPGCWRSPRTAPMSASGTGCRVSVGCAWSRPRRWRRCPTPWRGKPRASVRRPRCSEGRTSRERRPPATTG